MQFVLSSLSLLHQRLVLTGGMKNRECHAFPVTKAYLGPFQTSMELFCEYSLQLKALNYFLAKGSIRDVCQGPKYVSEPY